MQSGDQGSIPWHSTRCGRSRARFQAAGCEPALRRFKSDRPPHVVAATVRAGGGRRAAGSLTSEYLFSGTREGSVPLALEARGARRTSGVPDQFPFRGSQAGKAPGCYPGHAQVRILPSEPIFTSHRGRLLERAPLLQRGAVEFDPLPRYQFRFSSSVAEHAIDNRTTDVRFIRGAPISLSARGRGDSGARLLNALTLVRFQPGVPVRGGTWPSGEAAGFEPVQPGSTPGAPASTSLAR